MNYYRCENPDCGFLAEEEPDVCPQCGGTFFLSVDEEELTGPDWVQPVSYTHLTLPTILLV